MNVETNNNEKTWHLIEDDVAVRIQAHGRSWTFADLVALYGRTWCLDLARAWGSATERRSKKTTEKSWRALKRFLIAGAGLGEMAPGGPSSILVRYLRDLHPQCVPADVLANAAEAVVSRVRDRGNQQVIRSSNERTRANFVPSLNAGLRWLAEVNFLPEIRRIRGIPAPANSQPSNPSLSELTPSGRAALPVEDGVSLDSHTERVLALAETRLEALRSCLEAELLEEYEKFLYGRRIIGDTSLPDADTIDYALADVNSGTGSTYTNRVADRLKVHFGSDCSFLDLAIRWVGLRHDGGFRAKALSRAQQALLALAGGSRFVVRYLEATKVATNACFGLLMCDTAFNVHVMEDLAADPIVGGVTRGRVRVETLAARKARAGGKSVVAPVFADVDWPIGGAAIDPSLSDTTAELQVKDRDRLLSGVDAIRIYEEMSAPLRRRAEPVFQERFWLVASGRSGNGGRVTNNLVSAVSEWWPEFIARHAGHPVIGGLPITRAMIRTTVLQVRAGRAGFNHAVAQSLANHTSGATTYSYIGAPWFRAQLAAQIRTFQELFEAALVETIPGAPEVLGIDELELQRRVNLGLDAGIDFVCLNSSVATTAGDNPRPTCDPLDPCAECPVRRFVPTEENFMTLHLAHVALLRAEERMAIMNPTRWEKVWLPWRALTEAYVQKLRASPHKRRYEAAVSEAARRLATEEIALPIVA